MGNRLTFVPMKTLILALTILLSINASATEGDKVVKSSLQGKVLDAGNHEYLVGAAVRIPELNLQTYCNFDGEFQFADLPVGTYSVEIKLVSYKEAIYIQVEVSEKVKLHKFVLEAL